MLGTKGMLLGSLDIDDSWTFCRNGTHGMADVLPTESIPNPLEKLRETFVFFRGLSLMNIVLCFTPKIPQQIPV